MGEPLERTERPRDRLSESFLLMRELGMHDPLSLPVNEFDGLLLMVGRGEIRRIAPGENCRSFVEQFMNGGS